MRSFYHQRCLLTPGAPSKIVWLTWLLKPRRVNNRAHWHVNGTMDRMLEHSAMRERLENLSVTSSDKATFQKCFHQVLKTLLESIFVEDSLSGYPVHFSSAEVNFNVLTFCLGIM